MKKILWWKKINELKYVNHSLEFDLETQKRKNSNLNDKVKDLETQIDHLKSIIRGDRVCDRYCTVCSNHLDSSVVILSPYGDFQKTNGVICKLDCKCPDYKEVEK